MPSGLSVTLENAVSKGQLATVSNPAVLYVRDVTGAKIYVTTSGEVLHGKCKPGKAPGIHVTPATFTLSPGGSQKVVIHVPKAKADYGVLLSAHPLHVLKGVDTPVGAIGAQVLTGGASDCVPHVPVASSAGIPALPLAFGIIGAAIIAVIVMAVSSARKASRRVRAINAYVDDSPSPPDNPPDFSYWR